MFSLRYTRRVDPYTFLAGNSHSPWVLLTSRSSARHRSALPLLLLSLHCNGGAAVEHLQLRERLPKELCGAPAPRTQSRFGVATRCPLATTDAEADNR